MSRWRLLAAAAGLVAVCDVVQPLLLPWTPKLYGAMGGAVLYAAIALGGWWQQRPAAFVAIAVPVLPIAILALTAAGVALPVHADAAMVGILAIQLSAALAAASALRG